MHKNTNDRENGMNNCRSRHDFLVVAQLESGTIPLRLCSTREDALGFIAKADERTIVAALTKIQHHPVPSYLGVVSIAIIDFRDGEPHGCDVVRYGERVPARVQLEKVWREMGLCKEDQKL